ncbi:transglycosylase SLT domain-containing protein [Escherichia coli]|uniref:transglycosylase SLT domain-containing protein n=1 Tax=Escherichia coli TaxID=562 RepID=UPI00069B4FF0|nr:transglycosylase SLT domain-containing protein [Escherichia coli]EFH3410628.1 transglycosylase SLT domain-containing protein [Escherichia coli]EFH3509609.1 transglycosylase SLT domain-containing protein [Escherichia coli]EGH1358781.1 transglycosylase SLT domain-containing protein [Escherichia coli]EGM8545146.1 transglycosylase SLT domain-containing protein [Escherichia coli]EJR8421241.1 transglycosylase SLT domain-containing protein [Escherichia coli]
MGWPQITWIVLVSLSLGIEMMMHSRTRKHNFWGHLASVLVVAGLLWCGGFFSQAHAAEPPTAAKPYRAELVRNARAVWGMDAPVADFAGQFQQESGWNPAARSPVGAQGMAQFMPSTADWISKQFPELRSREPFNPSWAIRALMQYDQWLWQRVSGRDNCQRMAFTLSAYNGGLGWVNRDKKLATQRGLNAAVWFDAVATVNAGRSAANWRENRGYPQRILYQNAPRYLSWGGANCVR